MISSFRNFAKTKFAGLLVFIMIIPFVFWGMGSMFSSGNTNNLAKINKSNIFPTTIMDGELPSLFPYAGKKNLWTLTHSKYTHIKKFKSKLELEKYKNYINKRTIIEIKNNMEKSLKNYYPKFLKDFKFTNYYFSQKCLPKNKSSERLVYFKKKDKIISYFSPKIQNIFSAETHLKALLKNE